MNKVIEFTPRSNSKLFIIVGFLISTIAVGYIVSSDSLTSGQSIFGYCLALISILYVTFALFLEMKKKSRSAKMEGKEKVETRNNRISSAA